MKKYNTIDNFDKLTSEAVGFDDIFDNTNESKEFLDSKLSLIKKLNFEAKVKIGKMKCERVIQNYAEKVTSLYNAGRSDVRELIQGQILTRNPQFQFRKLDKLDVSDLTDLLDDVELLKIIEDIGNKGNENK